jgi:hypothetical protein
MVFDPAMTRIPRVLHRTVPETTSHEIEGWWTQFQQLHPGWVSWTWREPLQVSDVLVLPPGAFYNVHFLEKSKLDVPAKPYEFARHMWHGSWLSPSERKSLDRRQLDRQQRVTRKTLENREQARAGILPLTDNLGFTCRRALDDQFQRSQ